MALIITLVAIGILLLAIELLITPGVGLPGILGLLAIAGGVVLSFMQYGQTTGMIVLASVIIALTLSTWLFLRSKTWKKISLNESITARVSTLPQDEGLEVGTKGVAISRLAPSGKVRFDQLDKEVWAQSGIIDNGTPVEIVDIEGSKITVKSTNN